MERIVVLPDIHTPNHEYKALGSIYSFIKFYKPHYLIQLGDFCDWDSVSSYDPHHERDITTIDREIASANLVLDDLDRLCKKTKRIMIGGNHEDRYEKFRITQGFQMSIRRMKDFSSWDREYNLHKRGWEVVPYGGHYSLGKVIFTHGWFASGSAAAQMARCFPGRNVIFGHTHKHLIHGCMDERGLPIESESIGTLSKFDLSYLKGKPPVDWIHGFLYIDMREDGTFAKHFVRVIQGKFIEYGREFC